MNLRHIEVFHAVMSAKSVTGAADLLNVSQPAVSTMLKHVETQLGVTLFQRVKGRLSPTPEALELFSSSARVFALVEQFRDLAGDLRQGRMGVIRVAATPVLAATIMPLAITRFYALYPEVHVKVVTLAVRDASHLWELADRITRLEADIGVGYATQTADTVDAEPLRFNQVVCIMSANDPLAAKRQVNVQDLADARLIGHSGTLLGQLIKQRFDEARVRFRPMIEIESHIGTWELVNEGAGTALTFLTNRTALYQRVAIREFVPRTGLECKLFFPKDRARSHLLTTFVKIIRSVADETGLPS